MKIRIFQNLDNAVFRVVVLTEDFSQEDRRLMYQLGEPEVDVGGDISYEFNGDPKTKTLGSQLVRIMHGFPLAYGFDSRDYEGAYAEAEAVGNAWKQHVESEIRSKMQALRSNANALPSEEVIDGI